MDLMDAIGEAVAYNDSPPPNEAATCLWVIYPLLQAAGYAPSEIHPQGSDSNGQYPDYTILPGKPECWYLEAKAWSIKLVDNHAQQALNYANTGGKRWVVLTNGHTWRLYDNYINGATADKFVSEVKLTHGSDALELFQAISKTALLADQLDLYARQARLKRALLQLLDDNSPLLKALWSLLKKEPGLSGTTRSELVDSIRNLLGPSVDNNAPLISAGLPAGTKDTKPSESSLKKDDAVPIPLREPDPKKYINGKKPVRIVLPDQSVKDIASWRALAVEVLTWLLNTGKVVPIPFKGSDMAKRYFLNSTPSHPNEPMSAYAIIHGNGSSIYIDLHRSGWDLTSHACRVCNAAGVNPSDFRVQVI